MGIFPFETSGWFLIETIRLSAISPQYHTLNRSKMEGDKKTRRKLKLFISQHQITKTIIS